MPGDCLHKPSMAGKAPVPINPSLQRFRITSLALLLSRTCFSASRWVFRVSLGRFHRFQCQAIRRDCGLFLAGNSGRSSVAGIKKKPGFSPGLPLPGVAHLRRGFAACPPPYSGWSAVSTPRWAASWQDSSIWAATAVAMTGSPVTFLIVSALSSARFTWRTWGCCQGSPAGGRRSYPLCGTWLST